MKDAYLNRGEEYHLGNTGQLRMEVNVVTAPVMSDLVIYALFNNIQTRAALVIEDCENNLNAMGNCYFCNMPSHVKRDFPAPRPERTTYNRGQRNELSATTVTRKDTLPKI